VCWLFGKSKTRVRVRDLCFVPCFTVSFSKAVISLKEKLLGAKVDLIVFEDVQFVHFESASLCVGRLK
jgi:hypothetical protein